MRIEEDETINEKVQEESDKKTTEEECKCLEDEFKTAISRGFLNFELNDGFKIALVIFLLSFIIIHNYQDGCVGSICVISKDNYDELWDAYAKAKGITAVCTGAAFPKELYDYSNSGKYLI